MAYRNRQQIEAYFDGFGFEFFEETTPDTPGLDPNRTHNHLFRVIAKKL
jgi:hypothetical protein